MTTEEYRACLARLGLRQVDVSWMAGVGGAHGRKWALGKTPIPQAVSLLLIALEQGRISPTWLRWHILEPIPYNTRELP